MMRRNAYLVPTLGLLLMSECCGFILQLKNNEHNKRSVFRQMVDAEPKDERQANHGAVTTGINIQAQSNSHHRQESTGFPTFVEEEYEQYSRSLSPREERNKLLAELESESKMGQETKFPLLKKWLHYSTRFIQKTTSLSKKKVPGKLIMIRCGESTSSAAGLFTGWLDPDLTDHGVQECVHAAQVLLGEGFDQFDVVYTSRLQRAIKSAWIILEQLNVLYIPVYKTYRLNPRMFGALQGLSKEETMKRLGINAVQAWQQSLKAKPPPCDDNQIEHPKYDARYRDLQVEEIPSSESLLDCQRKFFSNISFIFWFYAIEYFSHRL